MIVDRQDQIAVHRARRDPQPHAAHGTVETVLHRIFHQRLEDEIRDQGLPNITRAIHFDAEPVAEADLLHPQIGARQGDLVRSEEHTSELQSLMPISYAVFCLKKKTEFDRQEEYTTEPTNT